MKIVSDNTAIINVQGIRYIQKVKSNRFSPNDTGEYGITITYKGNSTSIWYQHEHQRDDTFAKLAEAMRFNRNNKEDSQ